MADSLLSPPSSRATSPALEGTANSPVELSAQLDRLLEQYLELLDQYSTLRDEISKTFSTGFFALANAQRTANLGAGRRYGQEAYDGRMKASRRLRLGVDEMSEADGEPKALGERSVVRPLATFSIVKHETDKTSENMLSTVEDTHSRGKVTGSTEQVASNDSANEHTVPDKKPDPAFRDPASWFGLLIPQQLRQTQKSFVTSIDTAIPALINTTVSMTAVEQEIWEIRKALGIEQQYSKELTTEAIAVPVSTWDIDQLLAKAKLAT